MSAVFSDRREAGRKLAQKLTSYADCPQATVLGLPRGGVPVAYEIAQNLNLPLDVCLVKKIGLPHYPEVAVGAVVEDALIRNHSSQIAAFDRNTARRNGITRGTIEAIAARVKAELKWRESYYRQHRPLRKIDNSVVIVVDDGIATGLTMYAAVTALQQHKPQKIIIAAPVALEQILHELETLVDEIACLVIPKSLGAVGFWYRDFSQISDEEVCNLLSQAAGMEFGVGK